MWIGEVDKSEGMKFTGSADQSGNDINKNQATPKILIFKISLYRKTCVNLILTHIFIPPDTELPLKCRSTTWTPAMLNTRNGTRKCSA